MSKVHDFFCKNEAPVNYETHKCHYVNLVSGSGSLLQTKQTKNTQKFEFHSSTYISYQNQLDTKAAGSFGKVENPIVHGSRNSKVVIFPYLLPCLACHAKYQISDYSPPASLRLRFRVTSPNKFQDQIQFSICVSRVL